MKSVRLVKGSNMGRMFPDSLTPIFWVSEISLLMGEWKVEPCTAASLLRAVAVNLWRLNLYRWRWLLWRIGFVDIGFGEAWGAARWRWRWWLPRTGERPHAP